MSAWEQMEQEARPAAGRRPARIDRGTGVMLEFVGEGAFALRGPRSGRTYHVTGTGDLLLAHPDDVEEMLRRCDFIRPRAPGPGPKPPSGLPP